MEELLRAFFASLWLRRPNDIDYRSALSIQAAVSHLREQTRMTREELSGRLGVGNSRLAYLEARGNYTEGQFNTLINLAEEYSMPNLAGYFRSKLVLFNHKLVRGNKVRGRRAFNE